MEIGSVDPYGVKMSTFRHLGLPQDERLFYEITTAKASTADNHTISLPMHPKRPARSRPPVRYLAGHF